MNITTKAVCRLHKGIFMSYSHRNSLTTIQFSFGVGSENKWKSFSVSREIFISISDISIEFQLESMFKALFILFISYRDGINLSLNTRELLSRTPKAKKRGSKYE
jgi:hypothetical protein